MSYLGTHIKVLFWWLYLKTNNSDVVFVGMFDSTNGVDHAITAGNSQSQDKHDKKPLKTDRSNIPTGVIGVGMNRQGSNDEPNLYVAEELEEVSIPA